MAVCVTLTLGLGKSMAGSVTCGKSCGLLCKVLWLYTSLLSSGLPQHLGKHVADSATSFLGKRRGEQFLPGTAKHHKKNLSGTLPVV